jgi:hypothetical protein
MAYTHQIRILETKAKQLERESESAEKNFQLSRILGEIKRLRKLEWEETHERLDLGEDR